MDFNKFLGPLLLREWIWNQQHQPDLGTYQKCQLRAASRSPEAELLELGPERWVILMPAKVGLH